MDSANSALTRSKTTHDRLTKTYALVSTGLGRQKPGVDVMKAVSDSIPKASGVHLTNINFERGAILSLHGSAASEAAATELLVTMQANPSFKEVKLNYLGDAQAEGGGGAPGASDKKSKAAPSTSFLISCRVVGADQKLKVDTIKKAVAPAPTSASASALVEKGAAQ